MKKKIIKGEYIELILRSPKTIFSINDVAFLWLENDEKVIKKRLSKYVQSHKLVRVRRGLYAKDTQYNRLELATRINTPSYISFETVLTRTGTNFQYYGNIFIASYVNREIIISKQKYTFIRMKDYVLSNTLGIKHTSGIAMATKERAFLDRLYVNKEYYLDNSNNINWNKILEIVPLYNNKRLEKQVAKLIESIHTK